MNEKPVKSEDITRRKCSSEAKRRTYKTTRD